MPYWFIEAVIVSLFVGREGCAGATQGRLKCLNKKALWTWESRGLGKGS